MRFALMIEPQQGLSYGQQVAIAKRAKLTVVKDDAAEDVVAKAPEGPES